MQELILTKWLSNWPQLCQAAAFADLGSTIETLWDVSGEKGRHTETHQSDTVKEDRGDWVRQLCLSYLPRREHILSVSCSLHHSFISSPFPSLSSGLFEGVAGLWPLHQVDPVEHGRLRGHDAGGVRRRGHARSESQRHHFCWHSGHRVRAPGRRGGSSEEGVDVLPRRRLGPRQCQWVGRHRY